jgi:hypothetical protein
MTVLNFSTGGLNMKIRIAVLLIVSLCLLAFSSVFANDQNWRLAIRDRGVVENQYSGRGSWHRIWQSRMLNDGDRLRTQANSRARVQLPDNSIISIGENSEVEMSEFKMNDQSRIVKVKLFMGRVRSRVGHFFGKESSYEVETPNGVLAARGTDFLVQHTGGTDAGGQTTLLVYSSAVDVTAGGQTMTIPAGNSAVIAPTGMIFMNPAGVTVQQSPVETSSPDADLFQAPAESSSSSSSSSSTSSTSTTSTSSVPADPISNTTTTGVASSPGTTTNGTTSGTTDAGGGTGSATSGTVQPPQITTGEVIIEIVPQK